MIRSHFRWNINGNANSMEDGLEERCCRQREQLGTHYEGYTQGGSKLKE